MIRAIQNGCLNYLRSLHSRERIIDEYREALLEYQEEFCTSECSPLQEMELADLEKSVQNIVSSLPDKCRFIFEQYLYSNLTPQEIADKNNISVNTDKTFKPKTDFFHSFFRKEKIIESPL